MAGSSKCDRGTPQRQSESETDTHKGSTTADQSKARDGFNAVNPGMGRFIPKEYDRTENPQNPADAAKDHIPRAVRSPFDSRVCFVVEGRRINGQCLNLSESGLLATFEQPLELWTRGQLTWSTAAYYLSLEAHVSRVQGNEAGLAFLIESENDRLTISLLTDFASQSKQE
jgi:hypothetical protein